jgi:hypothetical protein
MVSSQKTGEKIMNLELHSTGASFVAGKEENNPRDLVLEVIQALPDGTRTERFNMFRNRLADMPDDYQRAVEFYFFVNMHDYFTTSRSRPDPMQRAQAVAKQRDMVESIKAQIVLLDLTMPNGKAMKDCTGAEMAKFGNRYQRIAEKVGKAKLVGAVLDEAGVRRIMA